MDSDLATLDTWWTQHAKSEAALKCFKATAIHYIIRDVLGEAKVLNL